MTSTQILSQTYSVLLCQSHAISPQRHPELKVQPQLTLNIECTWPGPSDGILIQVVIWTNGYDLAELIVSHLCLQMFSL